MLSTSRSALILISCLSFLSSALAYGNMTHMSRSYNGDLRALSTIQRRDGPNCTGYGGSEGAICGDLCDCNVNGATGLFCNAGQCSKTAPDPFTQPGCTVGETCANGMKCGYTTADVSATGPTGCGGKKARCTKQTDCAGMFVCVDAQYNELIKGKDDYAVCDGADEGQPLICEYDENNPGPGNALCAAKGFYWDGSCGKVRTGSKLSGVCNGMFTPCTLATPDNNPDDCFWGFCIGRTYTTQGGNDITNYCTWKPGPCDTDAECDNGLKCGPHGMCGGIGTQCDDNNFCSDPYPCMDDGQGYSRCADYDAHTGSGTAEDFDNNSGVGTVCRDDATCGGSSMACGRARPNSNEPGVCGGAGTYCSFDTDCATGRCTSGQCQEWTNAYLNRLESCTFSSQCGSGLACVDDGSGKGVCGYETSTNARVCTWGWPDQCEDDALHPSCGYARDDSTERGVCGGKWAACKNNGECWTGSCTIPDGASEGWCEFGPIPTVAFNYRRDSRSARQCPLGQAACPIEGASKNAFECIDVANTIDSCGGCVYGAASTGRDCTEIEHADDVACHAGKCVISQCSHGFVPSINGTLCVPQ